MDRYTVMSCWWIFPFGIVIGAFLFPALIWKNKASYIAAIGAIVAFSLLASWPLTWNQSFNLRCFLCDRFPAGHELWGPNLELSRGQFCLRLQWTRSTPLRLGSDAPFPMGKSFLVGCTVTPNNGFIIGYNPKFTYGLDAFGFQVAGAATPPDPEFTTGAEAIVTPIWFPLLMSLIPIAIWFQKSRKLRQSQRKGECPNCGYDLRASSDKCPECGTSIALDSAIAKKFSV